MALCQIIGPWDSQGLSPYSIIKSSIGVKSSLGANCQTTVSFTAQRLHASSLAAIYGSIMAALGLVQCQRGGAAAAGGSVGFDPLQVPYSPSPHHTCTGIQQSESGENKGIPYGGSGSAKYSIVKYYGAGCFL